MSADGAEERVASPCTSVCTMDASTGYCAGCLRTLDEIASWIDLSNDERRAVLAQLATRRHGRVFTPAPRGSGDGKR